MPHWEEAPRKTQDTLEGLTTPAQPQWRMLANHSAPYTARPPWWLLIWKAKDNVQYTAQPLWWLGLGHLNA